MAETPVPITTGNGSASIAGDLVSGNTYQQIKVVDGTIGGNTPLKVNADGSITASIYGNITTTSAPASVSGTVGASIIGLPPVNVTQFAGSPAGVLLPSSDNISTSINNGLAVVNFPYLFNGTNYDRWRGNSSIGALVTTGASSVIVANLQGASVSGTVGASIIGTVPVTGTLNSSFTQPSSLVSGVTSVITGTSSVQVLAPAPVLQRNYITNVLVTNAAAVGTTVELFDGGNVIYVGYAAASGGGFSASFPTALRQSSIAGNLSALSTVQASVFVSASGYTAA